MKRPFEGDSFLAEELINLIVTHHIRTVIETGTETGVTANAFGTMVQTVFTIDLEPKFDHLKSNVVFLHGDTRFLLEEAISAATLPILFYLDAHSANLSDPCPLPDELGIIQRNVSDPIIVIHDARVPDHPEFGWAKYSNMEISFDAIAHLIPPIYPNGFTFYHNKEAGGAKAGALFILPAASSQTPNPNTHPCT